MIRPLKCVWCGRFVGTRYTLEFYARIDIAGNFHEVEEINCYKCANYSEERGGQQHGG